MGFTFRIKALSVGIGLALPIYSHALMLSPIKLDSSQGEPLYAEIPFSHAHIEQPIQVALTEDKSSESDVGSTFNTFVRQNSKGEGVIVITSNKPIQTDHINLTLKINDHGQIRMQQLNNKLPSRIDRLKAQLDDTTNQPKKIANKDATVNLPIVKDNLTPNKTEEKPLILNNEQPPAINGITLTNDTPIASPNNSAQAIEMAKLRQNSKTTKQEAPTTPKEKEESKPTNYTVKSKDTLWSIASHIAQQRHEDLSTVMKAIQQQNPNAFPNGNPNILMQGTILTLPTQYQIMPPKKLKPEPKGTEQVKASSKTSVSAEQKQKAQQAKVSTKPQPTVEQPTQSHMSVVGSSQQGNVQGGNKLSSNETKALQTLVTQIQTQRSITLGLQNQVRQLDQTVKAKTQRIQVLNSRLAELEKQLKAKQEKPQPNKSN